jgi:nitrogen fixation/metabolism regulation signal transduction histidine kinase
LPASCCSENVVGFNVSIINKEEGFERIRKATQTLLIFLSIIAVLAIFAAWYFSGVAVRRIASLSATSELVRDGNLKVEFNAQGYDELATSRAEPQRHGRGPEGARRDARRTHGR